MAREQLAALLSEYGHADALRAALTDGRMDGSTFWDRDEAHGCAIATVLAASGHEDPAHAAFQLRGFEALEAWAQGVAPGDLPNLWADEISGSYRAAMLVRWIDEWEAERVVA